MASLIPQDVTITPSSVTAGGAVTCTVRLSGPPLTDQTVQITTDHSGAFTNLPTTIVVAANTTTKQFPITTNSSFGAGTVAVTAACNNGQAQGSLQITT